jgi:hypothetical protein
MGRDHRADQGEGAHGNDEKGAEHPQHADRRRTAIPTRDPTPRQPPPGNTP